MEARDKPESHPPEPIAKEFGPVAVPAALRVATALRLPEPGARLALAYTDLHRGNEIDARLLGLLTCGLFGAQNLSPQDRGFRFSCTFDSWTWMAGCSGG